MIKSRSEVELSFDHATPGIATADTIGVGGAGDVENTRCDADIVCYLELVPGFNRGGHATIFVPAGAVAHN